MHMHHDRSPVDEKSNLNQVLKASTRRGHRSSVTSVST